MTGCRFPSLALSRPARRAGRSFPSGVRVEPGLLKEHADAIEALRRMGHLIDPQTPKQGDAHSIQVQRHGRYLGVADARRSGAAAGL